MRDLKVTIEGRAVGLTAKAQNGDVLVPLDAFCGVVNAEIKRLEGNGSLAVCRDDLCIPLEANGAENTKTVGGVLYGKLGAFGEPLGLDWSVSNGVLHVNSEQAQAVGFGMGILLDEGGRLVRAVGSVNIDKEDFRKELTDWVTTGAIPQAWIDADKQAAPREMTAEEREADARFQLAIVLLESGKKDGAIAELKRAFRLDPQNWVIRKQLWAIETPEAFYSGHVDYGWQKEQLARENAEMEK